MKTFSLPLKDPCRSFLYSTLHFFLVGCPLTPKLRPTGTPHPCFSLRGVLPQAQPPHFWHPTALFLPSWGASWHFAFVSPSPHNSLFLPGGVPSHSQTQAARHPPPLLFPFRGVLPQAQPPRFRHPTALFSSPADLVPAGLVPAGLYGMERSLTGFRFIPITTADRIGRVIHPDGGGQPSVPVPAACPGHLSALPGGSWLR